MQGSNNHMRGEMSRRALLASAAAGAAVAALQWSPLARISAASAAGTIAMPPNFPTGIALYQQTYQNWSEQIVVDDVWTCAPTSSADVATLTNWAAANKFTLRPRGAMHGWSPFTLVEGAPITNVLLLDTTQHLTAISITPASGSTPASVTAGAGVSMDALLAALEAQGLGLVSIPAVGAPTLAGALAVDAHGAATPALGETRIPGTTYGSLSNQVLTLTAVVWDIDAYVVKTYTRADPEILALLTHLGRCFITEATLQAGSNYRLRCQSSVDVEVSELFGAPGAPGRTFASYVATAGRVEAIWFPFTTTPWLKVWTPTPTKPASSKAVSAPYNYTFSDGISLAEANFVASLNRGNPSSTPLFGQAELDVAAVGLWATDTSDIWGWSKDVLLYIEPSTLRLSEGGGAVITSRANIQRVVYEFCTWYQARIAYYRAREQYPINGPVEIRCCGLDQPADVEVPSAGPPTLSALRPHPDHPEWDTAIWINVLSIPGTPEMFSMYTDIEQWMLSNYSANYATFRPEWSKCWAFTPSAPFTNTQMLSTTIPNMARIGYPPNANWDAARAQFDVLDPAGIYTNTFLEQLLP